MEHCRRYGVVVSIYTLPLIAFLIVDGRELRPSDHGLAYQNESPPPAEGKSPAVMSFFGGTPGSSSYVPLPEAKNMSDASWWRDTVGGGGRRRDQHVKEVLLVASLVCGVSGVALLVVATLLFVFHFHKKQRSENNSLALCHK